MRFKRDFDSTLKFTNKATNRANTINMKKEYTKGEKKEYFANLRERWKQNKINADQDIDARAKFEAIENEAGKISYYSFYFTLQDMMRNNFEGNPYVDTKTFNGWLQSGFRVKKGEKSKIDGIVWMDISKEDAEDNILIPKIYHLFHRTQVEPI